MKRIKVLFVLGEWTYAGTARSHARIIEALDRTRFEPFAMYWDKGQNDILPFLKDSLGDHLIPYRRSQERSGPETGYAPISTDFDEVIDMIHPDIIHHARGGYFEWPLNKRRAQVQVETNVFGSRDASGYCDYSFFISTLTKDLCGQPGKVTYIPVPAPTITESYRGSLVPRDAFVCGRIGRPANFHPIGLDAFRVLSDKDPNAYFIYHSACEEAKNHARVNNIRNVIFLPVTMDEAEIFKFWNTLNVFCHARSDGECFGLAIAEAMAYGIPVLSHRSGVYDSHVETIGGGGVVCLSSGEYAETLSLYHSSVAVRRYVGARGSERARTVFSQATFIEKIQSAYLELLK